MSKPIFPKGINSIEKVISAKSGDRDALLFGMDIEVKSYDMYRKAALETNDPVGKQMFEFLTGQEQNHFDILMMRYDAVFGPVAWRY